MAKAKDPVAVAMANKRMKALSAERRREIASTAASARWAGHKAKRPASSRKKQ